MNSETRTAANGGFRHLEFLDKTSPSSFPTHANSYVLNPFAFAMQMPCRCHADAMQIILFCMADFLMGDLF
jgi:hypothetical protein